MTAWIGLFRKAWHPAPAPRGHSAFQAATQTLGSMAQAHSVVHTWRHAGLGVDLAWLSAPSDRPSHERAIHPKWAVRGERRWLIWAESSSWPTIRASIDRDEPIYAALTQWPGRYCGVCLDTASRSTHVFNDRFGLQRVFTYRCDDSWYVASRALPLVRSLPALQSWDLQAVAQTMVTGSALHGATLFQGLRLLPPSSCWTHYPDGRSKQTIYYQWPLVRTDERPDPRAWEEQLHHEVQQAITGTTRDETPMGMSLTGGWDGRLIMAYSQRTPNALPCYTFSSPKRECADARIARKVARKCQQPFHVLRPEPGWADRFDADARQVVRASDGAMDVSASMEIEMNRQATQVAPIRLTGNWGSEILRSHVALKSRLADVSFLDPSWTHRLEEADHTYRAFRQQPTLRFILEAQMPWHHTARLAVEDAVLEVRSPFLHHALVECMLRSPIPAHAMGPVVARLIQRQAPALAEIATDQGAVAAPRKGWSAWAQQWQKIVSAAEIKAEYWSDYGMPNALVPLNQWLGPWSPAGLLLGRHKFAHFRTWYQAELSQWMESTLLTSQALSRGIYEADALKRMVREHLSGYSNHTLALHRALTLELVAQEFFQPASQPW